VFTGREFGFAALASVVGIDPYFALDRLDYLVSHSLLHAAEPYRYRQHSLLADFAHELLADDREAYGRMAAYYLTFATDHAQDYGALRAEWSNLDAAIAIAHAHHSWPMLMAYTAVLRLAWFARGRYAQARQAFAWAQEAAMALEDDTAVADIWLHWGEACREQGDFDEAWQKLHQSLEMYRELENHRGITAVQGNLARIGLDRAAYDDVLARLDESLTISQTILADEVVTAELVYMKARLYHRRDDNQTARILGQEALALQEKVDDQRSVVRTLRLLAFVAIRLQEYDVAEQLNGRALALSEQLDDINELAMSHRAMTQVYWRKNQLDAARQSAETSLALLKKIGDRKAQALVEFQYLLIHKSAGEYTTAMHYAQSCLPIFEKLQFKDNIINTLDHMGDLSLSLGEPTKACAYWQRALTVAVEISLPRMITSLKHKLDSR
jgi:tetratricopeptide (TPR) repeat protein